MALSADDVGRTFAEDARVVDPAGALAYAAATGDRNLAYTEGRLAPPTYAYVVAHRAYRPNLDSLIPTTLVDATVHGEHDLWLHRPLVPGRRATSRMSVRGLRFGSTGARLIVTVSTRDIDDDQAVVDQYSVLFIRGLTEGRDGGEDGPGHSFPEAARSRPVGEHVVHVDLDITYRYAAATGDRSPIHLDSDFAQSLGLPGIVVHGMCTMAMTGQAVVETVACGEPSRLARLAVRFARPLLPGTDLTTTIHDAGTTPSGESAFAFEATSGNEIVITNGRAHVRPAV
jgi:acyl dehydratase